MIISARRGVIASTRSKPTAVAPTDPNFAVGGYERLYK